MIGDKKKLTSKGLSVATIRRLPSYLRILRELEAEHKEYVSTTYIGNIMGQDSVVVRKDLAVTGIVGIPKRGYKVSELTSAVERFLGWHNHSDAFIAGVGHLGRALLGYKGFSDYNLRIIAGFDVNKDIIGKKIHGIQIFPLNELKGLIEKLKVKMLILAVPDAAAQEVADIAIEAGIQGIWNFTPAKLKYPEHVIVQREDMAAGLAVLSTKLEMQTLKDGLGAIPEE